MSSGAEYQARVAAYLIVSALCNAPGHPLAVSEIRKFGFETAEEVDDLNLDLSHKRNAYLQVKKQLTFSTAENSELRSVVTQFAKQYLRSGTSGADFVLVTTSRSSKKVTAEMVAALDAYRLGDEQSFRRDQPKETVALLDELLQLAVSCIEPGAVPDRDTAAREILRRSRVLVIDIEENSSLEQSLILLLHAHHFTAPDQLWRHIISDCLTHAARRHSITIEQVKETYAKFAQTTTHERQAPASDEFLIRQLDEDEIPVGREVLLGTLSDDGDALVGKPKVLVFELIRFDNDCTERVTFKDGTCTFRGGLRLKLERRTATYQGMERYLTSRPEVIGDREVVIWPANIEEDLEHNLCAENHRRLLRARLQVNKNLLQCLHCAKPVSSADADHVESGFGMEVRVGLTHPWCTRVDDRVLGVIKSAFFERFDFLINFDVNAWFKAIQSGQGVFRSSSDIASNVNVAWSGVASTTPPGDYIVEARLEGGESEFVHHRGKIQRFSKATAEKTVAEVTDHLAEAQRNNDPICYSDQSKAVARRSTLLRILGLSEKLRPIIDFRVVRFDEKIAARYHVFDNWYAPLIFLRVLSDGTTLKIGKFLPVITNPIKLDEYLNNWKAAGLQIPEVEVHILKQDREFDDFMLEAVAQGDQVIADPIFAPNNVFRPVSGLLFIPMQSLIEGNLS